VLFRDPGVGRLYLHDSPYTYFTSDELHLGEISLECSRSGAAAAALWLTFQVLPTTPAGLGQVLTAGRRAALHWSRLIEASPHLDLYQRPELDIVCYFPVTSPRRLAAIDEASARMLADGMADPADPVFVSTLRVPASEFTRRHPDVAADRDGTRILRSVLMKPEHESYLPRLHERIEHLAAASGRLP
jgi:glutamate/tyrosine decarboxylase-like PLP-dependent enzyme